MKQGNLDIGFILDRQWFWLRGEMEHTKRPALLALARILAEAGVPYAIIGGIALQVHHTEPRTTLDIAVAVADYSQIPRSQLEAAGFTCMGRFSHSKHWRGPEGTPVQFTDMRSSALLQTLHAAARNVCRIWRMCKPCLRQPRPWYRNSGRRSVPCSRSCRINNTCRTPMTRWCWKLP